jgi:hypothetical protein
LTQACPAWSSCLAGRRCVAWLRGDVDWHDWRTWPRVCAHVEVPREGVRNEDSRESSADAKAREVPCSVVGARFESWAVLPALGWLKVSASDAARKRTSSSGWSAGANLRKQEQALSRHCVAQGWLPARGVCMRYGCVCGGRSCQKQLWSRARLPWRPVYMFSMKRR